MKQNDKFHQDNLSEIDDEILKQVAGGARLPNGVTLNAMPGYILKGSPDKELKCYSCGCEQFNMYVFQHNESDRYYECYNCGSWRTD